MRTYTARSKSLDMLILLLLYLTILSLPFDIWAISTLPGGRGIKPIWGAGILLILVYTFGLLSGHQKLRITRTMKGVFLFNVCALFSAINLFNSSHLRIIDFMTLWLRLIFLTFLFFTITSLDLTVYRFRRIVQIWVGLAFVLSLYAVYQIFARNLNLPLAVLPVTNPSIGEGLTTLAYRGYIARPASVFAEPSFFGTYLLSPLILAWIFWSNSKRIGRFFYPNRLVNGLVFGVISIAFLVTLSQGAYMALGGTLLVAMLHNQRRRQTLRFIILAIFILVIIGWITERILGINLARVAYYENRALMQFLRNPVEPLRPSVPFETTSAFFRFQEIRAALKIWLRHPLIGIGLNAFQHYGLPPGVTSGFIRALIEIGILGPIALGSIFIVAILDIHKAIRKVEGDPIKLSILEGFYYSVWAMLFNMLVARGWVVETIWMTLALAVLSTRLAIPEMNKTGMVK